MNPHNYHGWIGYTHNKKIPKPKQPEYVQKITHIFSSEGQTTETNGRTLIYNENFDEPIELKFKDETTKKEREAGLTKYGIKFESKFQDFWKTPKTHQRLIKKHQGLRDKFSYKITCEKQFFYLINYEMVRVNKKKRLKQRKK